MQYNEFKPHHSLSAFIECYWTAYSDKPPFQEIESLIPDGTIELMFNFGDDYSQIRQGQKELVNGSHIIGIRKTSLQISQTSMQNFFSIRFKPGGIYPFFKEPVHEYANAFNPLEEILGNTYKQTEMQLQEATSVTEQISIIENWLFKRFNTSKEYQFVANGIKELLNLNELSVKLLVKRMGSNYKTIERKFKQVMGLSPSEFIKIKRFNQAVLAMYACRFNSLTQIAYETGYYDQSHFIREFKDLTNFTPRDFLKEQFTIVKVIQPALATRMSKSYNLA